MNPDNPEELEFQHLLDLEKQQAEDRKVRYAGYALFLFVLFSLVAVNFRIPAFDPVKDKVLPVFAFLIPLIIARSYQKSSINAKYVLSKSAAILRLNLIGGLIIAAGLNFYNAINTQWAFAYIFALIAIYSISFAVALKPVFGDYVVPPSKWKLNDMILRTVVLLFAVFFARIIWWSVLEERYMIDQGSSWSILGHLLAATVLVPFYAGYFASHLPEMNPSRTNSISKEKLRELFPDESMPRLR